VQTKQLPQPSPSRTHARRTGTRSRTHFQFSKTSSQLSTLKSRLSPSHMAPETLEELGALLEAEDPSGEGGGLQDSGHESREERLARLAEALHGRACDARKGGGSWVLARAAISLKPERADLIAREILEKEELVSWAVDDAASDVLVQLLEQCGGQPWTTLASCKLLEEFDTLAGHPTGWRVLAAVALRGPAACREDLVRRALAPCCIGEAFFRWPDLLVRLLRGGVPDLGCEVAELAQQEHGLGWRAPLALTRCPGDLKVLEAVLRAEPLVFGVIALPAQLKDSAALAAQAPHTAAALAPLSPLDSVLL